VAKRLKQRKIANLCFTLLPIPRKAWLVLTVVIRSTKNEGKIKNLQIQVLKAKK
jgi:hypothetical protein